jgi:putative flavoprotein involved in K+ transport
VRDVVIVGAGPAGLSAAAMLRHRGIDATLLERGQRIGEPWRARYDRLHLHTIRCFRTFRAIASPEVSGAGCHVINSCGI